MYILSPSRQLFRSAIAKTRTLFTQDSLKGATVSGPTFIDHDGTLSTNVSSSPPVRINNTLFRNDYAPFHSPTPPPISYNQAMDPFAADPTAPSVYFIYEDDLFYESTEYSYERLISTYSYDESARVDLTDRSVSSPQPRDTTAYHDSIEDDIWGERFFRHSDSDDSDLFNFSPCASPFESISFTRPQPQAPGSAYGALFGPHDSSERTGSSSRDRYQSESYSSLCYLADPNQSMDTSFPASDPSSPIPSLEASFNTSKDSFESPCSSLGCPSPLAPRITLPSVAEVCSDSAFFSAQNELPDKYDWSHKSLVHVDGELFEMVAPIEHINACWLGSDIEVRV